MSEQQKGLELGVKQLATLKKLNADYQDACRALLEWRTPENEKRVHTLEMTLVGYLAPLLHDYLLVLTALEPFGSVWDTWAIQRILPDNVFQNFNRFAVYMLDDAYVNHFRNATDLFDTFSDDDDMPTAHQLKEAGFDLDNL
jgi:hypothetical protein